MNLRPFKFCIIENQLLLDTSDDISTTACCSKEAETVHTVPFPLLEWSCCL